MPFRALVQVAAVIEALYRRQRPLALRAGGGVGFPAISGRRDASRPEEIERGGPMELLILFICFAGLYLTPTFIAVGRSHHNAGAIFALNLLAGWTVIGWIGSLVWALTNRPKQV